MNLILLQASDYVAPDRVRLSDQRAQHIREVLGAVEKQIIKVGNIDGLIGSGEILRIDNNSIEINVALSQQPPAKLPLTIILALPRPKMLRRIIRSVAEFGVRELILINTFKVEKSYWQTPVLAPEIIRDYLLDGLQQSGDTVLPSVRLEKRFKPFVEDQLPQMVKDKLGLVAHPGVIPLCPVAINQPCTLTIGPEGGFTPYEIEKLEDAGLQAVNMGTRILRVENALTMLTARLFV
ncbi:MAG: Ribosomal small subunit methyltransferase [Verrucomicrobiaceae bacterium]|nr:Ribosomal small subunit methyltransferase [Verrucomicrobiaceae bacterium]